MKLVDGVRDAGGDVKIFSTMHVSGERELLVIPPLWTIRNNKKYSFPELSQLTGIAALLRFPLPELEETDDEDEDSDAGE